MATYEEVKNIGEDLSAYLIDVRSPAELKETGVIPASVNIPLADLPTALEMVDTDFKDKYDREKPEKDSRMIFSCKLGGRAQRAASIAEAMGFTNVKAYKGSWMDWAEKEGL